MKLLLFLPAAALICALTSRPASAQKLHCRQCTCDVYISPPYRAENQNAFFDKYTAKMSGGDGFSWVTNPAQQANGVWRSTITFKRLCGNGAKVDHTGTIAFYDPPIAATSVHLICDKCGKRVKCQNGSACQDSGIGVPNE